ncbi:MAG: (2Fe-2S) ferredoxin domain-containing protein [Elusimicrobia bacterium]|nr:(2Fe-2S) ferredoxin domain-containing protein [Elusimicrobiota bacterium]MDE2236972.1 (2Fe-2S) ferredoxin domain-containing protein [Elusimicrobiota bacterium]MDE2425148.1 (2Fe-2S) ferredoxin domain-containing protein [Elusimicrobiota bacterium]
MDRKPQPYRRTVFVCVNKRGDGLACANEGRDGEAICAALKTGVKQAGLKGRVRVARSGCLDLCAKGPNLLVYPEGDWYSGVSLADVPALLGLLAEKPRF